MEAESANRSQAFVRLADRHLDAAYRLARAIMRNPAEAEDATHDAIVQAWQKWPTLRDPLLFEHWFDRILINTCRNRLRRSTRTQTRDISAEVAVTSGDAFAGRMTATCSVRRSPRFLPSTASSSRCATTATCQSRRSPAPSAFPPAPSTPAFITPSSDCMP